MNHVYRLKRSGRTQQLQPVPETARAAGKGSRTGKTLAQTVTATLASVALGGMASLAHAQQAPPAITAPAANQLPQGGVVTRGSANINTSTTAAGNALMSVNQSSQRAVIDWASFNVGSQAKVQFNQPSSNAVVLNNILGNNASQIYGQISANGQVFLSNPNGVYFSPTAQVNVGGLVATTGKANADEFMAGKASFNRAGSTGSVVNEGQLTSAAGGYIALLAPEVRNQGVVVAQAGTVALASGEAITLSFHNSGTGLAGITTTPQAIAALVENRSAVLAEGGQIILSAHALATLQGSVVKNSGQLSATSLTEKGGKIVLMADSIALTGTSQITANGPQGGGTVLVGGDWQGSGDTRQAVQVTMASGASIEANATGQGDGGKVVLWSDVHNPNSVTDVHGSLKAEGGQKGGNGGRIETSGHHLDIGGARVSTEALQGTTGEWLLDPYDITINATGPTSNITSTSTSYTANADSSVILISSLVSALASNNVTIATGAGGGQNGDITISDSLSWTSLKTLTLNAAGSIILDANVSWTNPVNTMSWTATNGGLSGAGNITMPGSGNGTGFSITQGGNTSYAGAISGAGDFTKAGNGTLTLTGSNAYTGDSNNATAATTVSTGGTLQVGNGGTSGTLGGGWIKNSGTLIFNRSDSSIISQPMQYTTVSPAVSSTGLMKIVAGTWQLNADNLLSPKSVVDIASVATLDIKSYSNSVGGLTGSGTVTSTAPTGVLTFANGIDSRSEFSGQITGSLRVVMNGWGTQVLSGVNTYSGTNPPFYPSTTINFGTLQVDNAGSVGTGNIQINAYGSTGVATLAINGVSLANNVEQLNAPGTNVIKSVSTTNVSTLSGTIYAGGKPFTFSTVADSKLVLSGTLSAGTMQHKFTPASGGEVQITGPITSSAGSKLTLDGPGKLTLAGSNTAGNFALEYAANTTGTVRLASNTALGNTTGITVPEGATLELGKLDNSNLTIANKTLTLASSSNTSGGGEIVNLQGNNEWSGAVTLNNNSEVSVNANSSLNFSSESSKVVENGQAYLNVDGNLTFGKLTGEDGASYVSSGSGALSTNTLFNLVSVTRLYARLYSPTGVYSSVYGESPTYNIGFYTAASGGNLVALNPSDYTGYNALTTFGGMPSNTSVVGTYSVNYTAGLTISNANYRLAGPGVATDWTITQRALTLVIPGGSRVYDGTTSISPTGAVTLLGVVNGDSVSFAGSVTGFVDKDVGTNKAVTYTGPALSGAGLGNYMLAATPNSNAEITPVPIVEMDPINIAGALIGKVSKIYDGSKVATLSGNNYQLTGWVGTEGASVRKTVGFYDTPDAGSNKTVTVLLNTSDYQANIGTDLSNYILPSRISGVAGEVIRAPLTISGIAVANKTYDGSTVATVSTTNVVKAGLISGDVVSVSSIGKFIDKQVGIGKSVILSSTYGGKSVGNYVITDQVSTSADIKPAALTISGITAQNKTYDGTTAATVSTANVVKSGLIAGDVVTISASGGFADKQVANGKLVGLSSTHTGADVGNYAITDQVSTSADIKPAALTISGITAQSKTYDGSTAATVSTANVVKSGLIAGDVVTISASGTFADPDVGIAKSVNLLLLHGGSDAGNYTITDQAITKANISAALTTPQTPGVVFNIPLIRTSLIESGNIIPSNVGSSSSDRGSLGMEEWAGPVKISLVAAPSAQTQGLITVLLPKGSVQVAKEIVISVAEKIGQFISDVAPSDVTVSLPNNLPLPSWITYSASESAFILKAVPNGALPLIVEMAFKDIRFFIRISESGTVNLN